MGNQPASQPDQIQGRVVRRKLLTETSDDTIQEYLTVRDRVERYVKPEHGIRIQIQSIERIQNSELDRKLRNCLNELHASDRQPQLLFHGTTKQNAEKIIEDGFKVGSGGMFGPGIYFATDSTKSAQYCRDNGAKYLLLCDVAIGKPLVCKAADPRLSIVRLQAEGCDSAFAKRKTKSSGGVLNDEYIVYRAEQAAPRYLVKFISGEMSAMVHKEVQCDLRIKLNMAHKKVQCNLEINFKTLAEHTQALAKSKIESWSSKLFGKKLSKSAFILISIAAFCCLIYPLLLTVYCCLLMLSKVGIVILSALFSCLCFAAVCCTVICTIAIWIAAVDYGGSSQFQNTASCASVSEYTIKVLFVILVFIFRSFCRHLKEKIVVNFFHG